MNKYILHLETSTTVCSVAVSQNGKLLTFKETNDKEYKHSEQLTLYIKDVVESAGLIFSNINAVSISAGPGSYTGLRIGTSTAKGLCYALDIPLISISSLENLALLAHKKYPKRKICTLIDARRMEAFTAIYDADMKIIKRPEPEILDEKIYTDYEPFVAVGNGTKKIETLWKNRNITIDFDIIISAIGHVELAYQKYTNKLFENTAYFEPSYLKEWQNR